MSDSWFVVQVLEVEGLWAGSVSTCVGVCTTFQAPFPVKLLYSPAVHLPYCSVGTLGKIAECRLQDLDAGWAGLQVQQVGTRGYMCGRTNSIATHHTSGRKRPFSRGGGSLESSQSGEDRGEHKTL